MKSSKRLLTFAQILGVKKKKINKEINKALVFRTSLSLAFTPKIQHFSYHFLISLYFFSHFFMFAKVWRNCCARAAAKKYTDLC